jgi:hypothetical protein
VAEIIRKKLPLSARERDTRDRYDLWDTRDRREQVNAARVRASPALRTLPAHRERYRRPAAAASTRSERTDGDLGGRGEQSCDLIVQAAEGD